MPRSSPTREATNMPPARYEQAANAAVYTCPNQRLSRLSELTRIWIADVTSQTADTMKMTFASRAKSCVEGATGLQSNFDAIAWKTRSDRAQLRKSRTQRTAA